jgi:hypothetical protein
VLKGNGKLGDEDVMDIEAGTGGGGGGYDVCLVPDITSDIDGRDWRCEDSESSDGLRGSTGEIMPAMLGPDEECECEWACECGYPGENGGGCAG